MIENRHTLWESILLILGFKASPCYEKSIELLNRAKKQVLYEDNIREPVQSISELNKAS